MVIDVDHEVPRYFSRELMCPTSGIAYPNPNLTPFLLILQKGACTRCNGLGITNTINVHKVIPDDTISIKNGGIVPLGEYKNSWIFKQVQLIAERYNFKLSDPIKIHSKRSNGNFVEWWQRKVFSKFKAMGVTRSYEIDFEGIASFIEHQYKNSDSNSIKRWAKGFMDDVPCSSCHGGRLKKESLHFKINGKNISELARLDISELANWFVDIEKKTVKETVDHCC